MLVIHSVNPTGLFSYGECSTIQLDHSGLVHLVGINDDKGGESNGSGKSSLFNSVCELLYADNPTGAKNSEVVNSVWGKGVCARIEFTSHENVRYRATYCRNWKKDYYPVDNDNKLSYVGTSLFLDKFVDGFWRDNRGAGMPQTRQKILDAIGIPYDRFLSICYMSNRIGSSFIRGTTKERVDLLSGITGVYEWDRILEKSRAQKRTFNAQIEAIQRKISYENGAIDLLKNQIKNVNVDQINAEIKTKEASISSLRDHYKTLEGKLKSLEGDIAQLIIERDASYNQDLVRKINFDIDNLNSDYRKISYIPENHVVVPKDLEKAISDSGEKASYLKGQLGSLQSESAKILDMKECPMCGGKVSEKKKSTIVDKIKDIQTELAQEVIKYQESKLAYDTFIYNAIEENKKANEIKKNDKEVILKSIEDKRRQSSLALERYTELNAAVDNINRQALSIKDERSRVKAQGESLKNDIERLNGRLADYETMSGQVLGKQDAIDGLKGEISGVETEIAVFDWLITNIPYIKLHKLSMSMSDLSDMINKYLMEMGDSIKVIIKSFDMKKDTKGAADIKDLLKSEIKIEIIDGNKNINPKLYSDGEIGKISNAFIRGLHDLALRSGYGCNLMMLDEIFSFIDEGNSQKISDSFTKSVKGKTVFITDNSGRVKDLVNFDKVWTVRKKNGQSKIEV